MAFLQRARDLHGGDDELEDEEAEVAPHADEVLHEERPEAGPAHQVPAVEVTTPTVQYSAVQCSTVQYSTVQYSTVQYSTVDVRQERRYQGQGSRRAEQPRAGRA